jgi:hypothetical protein
LGAHRRFGQWTRTGLWRRLHRAVLDLEDGDEVSITATAPAADGAASASAR